MKNIVLCGSMKVKDKIIEVANYLQVHGYNVLLPKECIQGKPKAIASRAHFNRIIDENNDIILVINEPKNGVENYIGPNTFAEIAFAFHFNKKIYLLNDIYMPYEDELTGWNVLCLKGDLNNLESK